MAPPTWFEAYDGVLTPVLGPHGLVNVLLGADSRGVLTALVEPTTLDELTARTGLPQGRVRTLLHTLVVHDVAHDSGGRYQLTEPWQALMSSSAFVTLSDTLASAEIEGRMLRDLAAGADYWEISPEERLVFARAISPDPFAPALVEAFRAQLRADPDVAVLAAGGVLLELGCGLAGRVLTMLQALPAMRAVGVELAEDLATEARRRAEALGVADRFEVVCCDAADFSRPEAFDVGFWSQFFFPAHAREPALRALFESIRPGGTVQATLLGDETADPRSPEGRHRALFRMILDGWGVPDRDPDSLAAELGGAGFVDTRLVDGPAAGPVRLVARRP
jgi:SAM-dependent methyltransferase